MAAKSIDVKSVVEYRKYFVKNKTIPIKRITSKATRLIFVY